MRAPMALRLLLALALLMVPGSGPRGQTAPRPPTRSPSFSSACAIFALKGDAQALDRARRSPATEQRGVRPRHDARPRPSWSSRSATGRRSPAAASASCSRFSARSGVEARVFTWQMDRRPRRTRGHDPGVLADRPSRSAVDRQRAVPARRSTVPAVRRPQPDPQRRPTSRCTWPRARRSSRRRRKARPPSCCSGAASCTSRRRTRPSGPSSRSSPATNSSPPISTPCFVRIRPTDFAAQLRRGHAHAAAGSRRPMLRRAADVLRRVHRPDPATRPQRSEPRPLVAPAAAGRPDCRDPHAGGSATSPTRASQSDAEDVSFFDRRRKQEHRGLRVGGEAGEPRPLLQRRRRSSTTTSRATTSKRDFSPDRLWIDGRARSRSRSARRGCRR